LHCFGYLRLFCILDTSTNNPYFMKQLLYGTLFFFVLASVFTRCKKDDSTSNGGYYIKGKKDGVAFTYSSNAMAMITDYTSSGAGLQLSLMANPKPVSASSMEGLGVSINFSNGVSIVPGTYTEDYSGYDYTAAGVYNPNSNTIVWGAGIHYPTVKPLKIIIATKTATEMTGTIEGAFYKQDVSTGQLYDDYTLFTECEFKLPVK
jgi:hypothetical protein